MLTDWLAMIPSKNFHIVNLSLILQKSKKKKTTEHDMRVRVHT